MKVKFVSMIAWGGSDDNETLEDVLNRISSAAPSARYAKVAVSAGWPVFEFEVNATELSSIAEEFDSLVEDLNAVPV